MEVETIAFFYGLPHLLSNVLITSLPATSRTKRMSARFCLLDVINRPYVCVNFVVTIHVHDLTSMIKKLSYCVIEARLHHGHLEHADGNGDWVLTIFTALSMVRAPYLTT